MSDSEVASSHNDPDEVVEYACRKCPGKTFTAAERDSHREFHRQLKEKEQKKRKPGPKSRTQNPKGRGSSRNRVASPPASEDGTLFEAAPKNTNDETGTRGKKRKESKNDAQGPAKRKSKKNYDTRVVGSWSRGNGA